MLFHQFLVFFFTIWNTLSLIFLDFFSTFNGNVKMITLTGSFMYFPWPAMLNFLNHTLAKETLIYITCKSVDRHIYSYLRPIITETVKFPQNLLNDEITCLRVSDSEQSYTLSPYCHFI